MSTPPSNIPFAPAPDDLELDAELERYRPDPPSVKPAPTSPPLTVSPAAVPLSAPTSPKPQEIQAMPEAVSALSSAPRGPEDMFANLDQSPKKPAAPTSMGDLPLRASSPSSLLKYIGIFIAVVVVLAGLGYGFWYAAIKLPAMKKAAATARVVEPIVPSAAPLNPAPPSSPIPPEPVPSSAPDPTLPGSATTDPSLDTNIPAPLPVPIVAPPVGVTIPPPQSIDAVQASNTTGLSTLDTDADGLTDQRELELGTDPRNKDTDGDGLSDGDEVLKYGTNPLDRDTDKDGFIDGTEVQKGYNPRGADKCSKPDCSI